MRMHFLDHGPCGGGTCVEQWAAGQGFDITRTQSRLGEPLPSTRDYDALVVMGGPVSMSEESRRPWLGPEKDHLAKAMAQGRHVLGLGYGARLMAQALGAEVVRMARPEVGWHAVRLTPYAADLRCLDDFPQEFTALHWHHEAFDLPRHAVLLAGSKACPIQAFALGESILGLQFHLEATMDSLECFVADLGHELSPGPTVQDPSTMRKLAAGHLPILDGLCRSLCTRFFR